MRLRDLNGRLLWQVMWGGQTFRNDCPTLEEAQGIMFLCPKCFETNKGSKGTHSVICWFVGKISDEIDPKPGRWTPEGTGIDDLTFVPGCPARAVSVLLTSGCGWHGFVTNGEAK